jgi:hypothetical protein
MGLIDDAACPWLIRRVGRDAAELAGRAARGVILALFACRLEIGSDDAERRLQLRTERVDSSDDRNRKGGRNQAVFDSGGARFISKELLEGAERKSPI